MFFWFVACNQSDVQGETHGMPHIQPPWAHRSLSVTSHVRRGLGLLGLLVTLPALPQAPVDWVGRFNTDAPAWQEVRLGKALTPNRFSQRLWDGVHAMEVHSNASMSLMARPLAIDLAQTPVLCWRWRVQAVVATADMQQRKGDDYAARVYVSFKLPDEAMGFGLRTKLRLARAIWGADLPDAALNYVWDNRHPVGTEQANAYTDRAMMVVLRSGNAQAGRWVQERRDVGQDVARLFDARALAVQLAVTADTDNTGQSAHAGFADFHFVPADSPCQYPAFQP